MTAENVCLAWTALEHRPERTVLDWRALSLGSPRKSGGGKDDAGRDDIGRRCSRKPPVRQVRRGRPVGRAPAGFTGLADQVRLLLAASGAAPTAPGLSVTGLKAGVLVGWEAMWLLAPGRTR